MSAMAPYPLPPGHRLAGRFVIESELPPATFGRVYRAYDQILGRVVAINVLEPDSSPVQRARFFKYALKASESTRRNTSGDTKSPPLVLDLGQMDGITCVVLAFVEGVGAALGIGKQ